MGNEFGEVSNLSEVQASRTPFIRLRSCKHRNLARLLPSIAEAATHRAVAPVALEAFCFLESIP